MKGRTIKVTVKLFATLREIAGKREERIEVYRGATVAEILQELVRRYGEEFENHVYESGTGRVSDSLQLLINGVNVKLFEGLKTRLKDGDVLALIPPVGGG